MPRLALLLCTISILASMVVAESKENPVVRLNLGLYTTHADVSKNSHYNENNQFIGLSYGGNLISRINVMIDMSTFENSFYNRSFSTGVSTEFVLANELFGFDAGIGTSQGLIYGYREDDMDGLFLEPRTMIYAAPYIYVGYNNFGYTYRRLGNARSHELYIEISEFIDW